MIRAFLAKEWRERVGLIVFSLLLLVGTAFLAFAVRLDRDLSEILSASYALVVLPVIALLLGTSAFSQEIWSGAWPYLLSRPVRKSKIWLIKLLSLATILIAFLAVHALLSRIFPVIKTVLSAYRPWDFSGNGLTLWAWSWIAAVFLFLIGFSLSAFSAVSPTLVFLGLLFAGGLAALTAGFGWILYRNFPFLSGFAVIVFLLPWSFLAAAGLAFARFDPSLPRENILRFAKFVSLFVMAALLAGTGWIAASGRLAGPDVWFSGYQVHEGNVYFESRRGISVYRSSADRLERIGKRHLVFSSFSIGGGKIAYFRWTISRRDAGDLWVMNLDGSESRRLEIGSELHSANLYLTSCSISRDGRTVAILTGDKGGRESGIERILWARSDGSGWTTKPLEFLIRNEKGDPGFLYFIGWSEDSRTVYFIQGPQKKLMFPLTLWAFNLDTQSANIIIQGSYPRISPGGRRFVFFRKSGSDETMRIAILDAATSAMEDIPTPKEDMVCFAVLSPEEDRLAIAYNSAGNIRIGIYSLAEKRWTAQGDLGPVDPTGKTNDWPLRLEWWSLPGEKHKLLYGGVFGEFPGKIVVLDEHLAEEKTIVFPSGLRAENYVFYAAGDKALVQINLSLSHSTLWRVDLKTGDWKRLR